MKQKTITHHLDGLIALLLFGVFAVCVLAVLLTGADAYRRLTARDNAAYDRRTCIQYIATQVRRTDSLENIKVTSFGDGDALILDADEEYVTYIYCCDGWLRELYCWAGEPMSPEDGEKVMELEALSLQYESGTLTIRTTGGSGEETELFLSLRSGAGPARSEEVAP